MKPLFILMLIFLSTHIIANELAWVDEQINAIKPPREGIKNSQLSFLKDPFIFLEKNKTKKDDKELKSSVSSIPVVTSPTNKVVSNNLLNKKLTLDAVLNNSALISGVWYKKDETVRKYILSEINRSHVVLKKGKKALILSTKSKNSNLKFKEK